MKKHLPNFITSLNMLCGALSITATLQGDLTWAAYWVIFGAFFDFIDGFVARLLHVSSELGKQLDSLCDVVTFGTAPAFIAFRLLQNNTGNAYLPYIALLTPIFAALRLAKFNLDARQSDRFFGLPVPANALFLIAIPCCDPWLQNILQNPYVLIITIFAGSLLMVSQLPLFAMKFKTWRFQDNAVRYIFITLSLLLLIILQWTALPIIIILYLLISLITNALYTKNNTTSNISQNIK